jgi:hypothetical protein
VAGSGHVLFLQDAKAQHFAGMRPVWSKLFAWWIIDLLTPQQWADLVFFPLYSSLFQAICGTLVLNSGHVETVQRLYEPSQDAV